MTGPDLPENEILRMEASCRAGVLCLSPGWDALHTWARDGEQPLRLLKHSWAGPVPSLSGTLRHSSARPGVLCSDGAEVGTEAWRGG